MNRTASAVLTLALAAGTLTLAGCEGRAGCEKRGGRWEEDYVPKFGVISAHWEYRCVLPGKPVPEPSIVTGVAGPGTVILRFGDGGRSYRSYLKIQQTDGPRVVQQVPADVYAACREQARWPGCAGGAG